MPKQAPLSNEKYVSVQGTLCPVCFANSNDHAFTYGSTEYDGPTVTQVCACSVCGSSWVDEYRLVGYDVHEWGAAAMTAEELAKVYGENDAPGDGVSRTDWREAVGEGTTELGYWDWVAQEYEAQQPTPEVFPVRGLDGLDVLFVRVE